jgi:hypothetical protein
LLEFYSAILTKDLTINHDETFLHSFLEKETKKNISLVITDNSSMMLSLREKGDVVYLRLHRMFLSAGMDVLNELSCFIKNKSIRTPLIRRFINQNTHCVKESSPRSFSLFTAGRYHELSDIFNSINSEYFESRITALITWGLRRKRRSARLRTLGSYCAERNIIRINPVLDSGRVPRYFLEFIVYHEMLHADIGICNNGKRRRIHTKEFRRRERIFKHYKRALAWDKKYC